ncbi:MAG: LemA family protein [Bacteroidota bacterium]
MGAIVILLAIPALLFLVYMSANNKLVALKNNRENTFADIDVFLKQRYDLIPQLVATVKGYMEHESSVLTRVTEARSNAINASGTNAKVTADNELSKAMGAFNVQVEAYPDLKANANFIQLQGEIAAMEAQLSGARQEFNTATRDLNNAIEQIPSNWVAQMKNMTVQPMFDLGAETRQSMDKAPEIKF